MKHLRYVILILAVLLPRPADAQTVYYPVLIGTMINAYSCISRFSNQVGYDPVSGEFIVIYRGGPNEMYPNEGMGSLVLATSVDNGKHWAIGDSILNADLPGNIPGRELFARHPDIFVHNIEGSTSLVSMWSTYISSERNPDGYLGEVGFKSGPAVGPYRSGVLPHDKAQYHFPSRIVSDMNGTLHALAQLRDAGNETLTGNFGLMRSTNNGVSWTVNTDHPALRRVALPYQFRYTEEAISMDVSPDGSTLYIGFVAIRPKPDSTRISLDYYETLFGWVRSTDGGNTWSDPVFPGLDTWDIVRAPRGSIDQVNGFVYPSVATAIDGLNKPHFLLSVNGGDRDLPPDSTLLGELILNETDDFGPPEFFTLARNILPQYDRFFVPSPPWTGPQPRHSILGEHEWSKSPDGMMLVAKWIDADSIWVTTHDAYPVPIVRDSTHDVYIATQILNPHAIERHSWVMRPGTDSVLVTNASQSDRYDEKFTKINPYLDPGIPGVGIVHTIMATSEWLFGQIWPDSDDQAPAELYFDFVLLAIPTGVEHLPGISADFSLAQNYPNPVRASTSIRFLLERAMDVHITVSDLLGRNVATLTDGFRDAGSHIVQFIPGDLPAGQYIYRMEAGGQAVTKMMSVVR